MRRPGTDSFHPIPRNRKYSKVCLKEGTERTKFSVNFHSIFSAYIDKQEKTIQQAKMGKLFQIFQGERKNISIAIISVTMEGEFHGAGSHTE